MIFEEERERRETETEESSVNANKTDMMERVHLTSLELQNKSRRIRRKIIDNDGNFLIKRKGRLSNYYFKNIFHTILNLRWRWFWLIFGVTYLIELFLFGLLYYYTTEGGKCITNVSTMSEAFFFSVQTGMTIGYGSMAPNADCYWTIIGVTSQSIIALAIDAILLGLTFDRISRPDKASKTVIFSHFGVICSRNGKKVLVIRVACIRKVQLAEAHVRLYYYDEFNTPEGEHLTHFKPMKLDDHSSNFIFIALPFEIVHEIDETSPLYGHTKESFARANTEFVVLFEAISSNTSEIMQARYSYQPSDILWGYQHEDIISRAKDGTIKIQFDRFSDVVRLT